MHRMTRFLAGAATIWLGLSLCGKAYDSLASTTPAEHPDVPPSIDSIREIAELTVLEVEATKIIHTKIRGYTGGTSVTVLVHGTLTYGVDLDQARYLLIDQEQHRLILALPEPAVQRVSIDPRTSRMLSCERTGLWQVAIGSAHEGEAFTQALAVGHQRLLKAAADEDLVGRARRRAEEVLVGFMAELGWTLEIHWAD